MFLSPSDCLRKPSGESSAKSSSPRHLAALTPPAEIPCTRHGDPRVQPAPDQDGRLVNSFLCKPYHQFSKKTRGGVSFLWKTLPIKVWICLLLRVCLLWRRAHSPRSTLCRLSNVVFSRTTLALLSIDAFSFLRGTHTTQLSVMGPICQWGTPTHTPV